MKAATDENGHTIFKLKALAETNGIAVPLSHSAMADASTTLALCQIIRSGAPEVWSQFLRFSQKATVESFMSEEDAFLVSETVGNHHRIRLVTPIGTHSERATRYYCLDLATNLDELREMSDGELICLCKSASRPIVTVRTNAAPTLWPLYDATQEHVAPFEDETQVLMRVAQIRTAGPFLERLRRAAEAAEPFYPPRAHVEEQLYAGGFPLPQDEILMRRFHAAPWEQRATLARQLSDARYHHLALRLIYLERPDLLAIERRYAADDEVRKRLMAATDANVPWRSIPAAQRDMKALLESRLEGDDLANQLRYLDYLEERAAALEMPISGAGRSCVSTDVCLTRQ